MTNKCPWNKDNVFFLTRSDGIEITSKAAVFDYSNQRLLYPLPDKEELDDFGRNYPDRQFILLCNRVDLYCTEDTFKSLSCRKVGERYVARLELTGMTLEYELEFMVELLEKMCEVEVKQADKEGRAS